MTRAERAAFTPEEPEGTCIKCGHVVQEFDSEELTYHNFDYPIYVPVCPRCGARQ